MEGKILSLAKLAVKILGFTLLACDIAYLMLAS
jgi:hypothetical protein